MTILRMLQLVASDKHHSHKYGLVAGSDSQWFMLCFVITQIKSDAMQCHCESGRL
jgi:hypothetical protein